MKRNPLKETLFNANFLLIIVVAKQILAFIPNVQVVYLLMVLFFVNRKFHHGIQLLIAYVIIDFIMWGFPTLMIPSFIAWGSLMVFLRLTKIRNEQALAFLAIPFTAVHMLSYGIHDMIIMGLSWSGLLAYLSAGVTFGLLFAVSSFLSIILLYAPLNYLIDKYQKKQLR